MFIIVYAYSAKSRPRWAVGGLFISCYGLFRFIVEFYRQPDGHIGFDAFGWLTRGQILSLPMIVAGVALIIWSYRVQHRRKDVAQDAAGESESLGSKAKKQRRSKNKKKRA